MLRTLPARRAAWWRTHFSCAAAATALCALAAGPVRANNYSESLAWQFQTSADRANQAAVLDLMARRQSGYYAAPIYTTNIARQYNCAISASATGNQGVQSSTANSPAVTGAVATATGNAASNGTQGERSSTTIDSSQANAGHVGAGIAGSTAASVRGSAWEALNSDQRNDGDQSASVSGASACAFRSLN